jgi:hypothetical protein
MSAAALQSLASAAAATIYDAIGVAKTEAELDELIKLAYRGNFDGTIDEADATHLHLYANQRRQRSVPLQVVVAAMPIPDRIPISEPNLRRVGSRSHRSRFSRRREQRSPDKQASYDRRHRLAYSGVLPRHLAPRLTIGEMAVMRIIADEVHPSGRLRTIARRTRCACRRVSEDRKAGRAEGAGRAADQHRGAPSPRSETQAQPHSHHFVRLAQVAASWEGQ